MARWTIPLLFPLVACDLTQSLQGPASDAGGPFSDAAHVARPTETDASTPDPKPSTDAASGAADATGQEGQAPGVSCPPSALQGTANVLATGAQPYGVFFDDVWFWQDNVYALAPPWSLVAAALPGGSPEVTNFVDGLPSFVAGAVGPAQPSELGPVTAQNVEPLPISGATFYGLRGPSGFDGARPGDVVVDGTDLFFWTTSPSQLVHSALATATETVIVPYSGESNESVTAMALTPSLVYFAAVVGTGQSLSTITLYSTPRSGGPVSVVVALPVDAGGQQPDGIILDGSAAYVTRRPADGGVSDGMLWVVNLADATATLAQLPAGAGSQQYGARTTNVAFDGTSLYWGQGRGNSCSGALMRAAITAITTSASAETLVENIEAPLSVGLSSGSAYVGTEGDSTHAPQVLVWSP